jgi:hypothetical protein
VSAKAEIMRIVDRMISTSRSYSSLFKRPKNSRSRHGNSPCLLIAARAPRIVNGAGAVSSSGRSQRQNVGAGPLPYDCLEPLSPRIEGASFFTLLGVHHVMRERNAALGEGAMIRTYLKIA